jgi:hypothetical protein
MASVHALHLVVSGIRDQDMDHAAAEVLGDTAHLPRVLLSVRKYHVRQVLQLASSGG